MPEIKSITSENVHEIGQGFRPEAIGRFERTKVWRDQGITWVMPFIPGQSVAPSVAISWMGVATAMNHLNTGLIHCEGLEVAEAYNHLFRLATVRDYALDHYPEEYVKIIERTRYVLTTEHDNVIPGGAVTELFTALFACPDCGEDVDGPEWLCPNGHHGFDAVSGLYMTKTDPPTPMAYGNPANGPDDFRPQSVRAAIEAKRILEVNGIAMGCALWRKDLFAKVEQPWFETTSSSTQDLTFCRRAKAQAGARFGVHCGVRVPHHDYRTGRVY